MYSCIYAGKNPAAFTKSTMAQGKPFKFKQRNKTLMHCDFPLDWNESIQWSVFVPLNILEVMGKPGTFSRSWESLEHFQGHGKAWNIFKVMGEPGTFSKRKLGLPLFLRESQLRAFCSPCLLLCVYSWVKNVLSDTRGGRVLCVCLQARWRRRRR